MISSPIRLTPNRTVLARALLLLCLVPACTRAPPAVTATLDVGQVPLRLQLQNLPRGVTLHDGQPWQEGLRLHHVNADGQLAPPVAGSYHVEGTSVEFRPAFPLLPGHDYQCQFDPSAIPGLAGLTGPLEVQFRTEDNREPRTHPEVITIHPSGDLLPANHLKFYIYFSEPMLQGDIFDFFSLFDRTTGTPVPRPFRHTELWSPDERRLTLWFHPGRQKTGVNLNVELGAILQEGHEYELRVNPEWTSRKGVPFAGPTSKSFRAGPPDRLQPDPESWLLELPTAGSSTPLRCDMQEPLDWALAHRLVQVEGPLPGSSPLAGEIMLVADDRVWQLTPAEPWRAGDYRLAVGVLLEDLAGNSVARPFEVDVTATGGQELDSDSLHYIHFTIPASPEAP